MVNFTGQWSRVILYKLHWFSITYNINIYQRYTMLAQCSNGITANIQNTILCSWYNGMVD